MDFYGNGSGGLVRAAPARKCSYFCTKNLIQAHQNEATKEPERPTKVAIPLEGKGGGAPHNFKSKPDLQHPRHGLYKPRHGIFVPRLKTKKGGARNRLSGCRTGSFARRHGGVQNRCRRAGRHPQGKQRADRQTAGRSPLHQGAKTEPIAGAGGFHFLYLIK